MTPVMTLTSYGAIMLYTDLSMTQGGGWRQNWAVLTYPKFVDFSAEHAKAHVCIVKTLPGGLDFCAVL